MSFYTKLAIVLAAAVAPFVLSAHLTRRWRMPEYYAKVCLFLFCLFVSAAVCWVGWPPRLGIDLRGGVDLVYELAKGREAVERKGDVDAVAPVPGRESEVNMDQLIAAISKRINPGGQKEITVRKYGVGQIEIIVPDATPEEIERIKDKISRAGTLEFRITANERDHRAIIERAKASPANEVYAEKQPDEEKPRLLAWWVPVSEGRESSFPPQHYVTRTVEQVRGGKKRRVMQVLVVNDPFNVTGAYLRKAATSFDEKARPDVTFLFDADGARLFGELTTANKPDTVQEFYRDLGIILDGYIYSAPRIQSPIFDRGQISGDFTQKQAQDLADVLNAGALPAALNKQPISELNTGPTLGSDTIRRGANAIMLSTVLVFAFMVLYYRFSGLVACLMVTMNIVITLAIMILFKAPLTLPGLAGLALTVGMAVDANVLIYERIREELSRQATLRMAIRNGFNRALSAIVDSNLTTLISSIVLYVVGTDQIKGFAVTLTVGVAASMFTAVFCAHVIFDVAERQKWISKLRMMQMLPKTNIDFYGLRRYCYAGSVVVIGIGLAAVWYRGVGLLDIDFTGGVSVQVVFNEEQDIAEIREKLSDLRDLSVSDVQTRTASLGTAESESEIRRNRGFIINTGSPPGVSAEDYLNEVKQKLQERFKGRLVVNKLTWTIKSPAVKGETSPDASPKKAQATAPAGPVPADPAPAVSTPAKPMQQGRAQRPGSQLAVSADVSAMLLARAVLAHAPVEDSASALPAAKPASGAAKPAPSPASPADAPKPSAQSTPAVAPKGKPAQGAPAATKPAAVQPPPKAATQPKVADKPLAKAGEKPSQTRAAEVKPEKAETSKGKPSEAEPARVAPVPAAAPEPTSTSAVLQFSQKISYSALEDLIRRQLETGQFGSKQTEFQLSSEGYEEGSEEPLAVWNLSIKLPPDRAEALCKALQERV